MRIECQNTPDDFRESAELLSAVHDGARLDQRLTADHFRRSIGSYGASMFIALIWLGMQLAPTFAGAPTPRAWTFLHLFMPFFVTTVIAAVARTHRAATDALRQRTPLRWYGRALLPAAILLLVLALLLYLRRYTLAGLDDVRPRSAIDWRSLGAFLFPHAGWIAVTIGANIDSARARREWYDNAWADRPNLAAPRTLEADDALVRITEPSARTEHDWHVFHTFFETPNLFLLLIDEQHYHVVPKRAFSDRDHESQFRDLLVAHITDRPTGFPVLPANDPAPPGPDNPTSHT